MAELTSQTPDRALTVPELAAHFDRSETWVKRLIRSARIDPIGRIHTGARGRPGARYSLSDVATALRDRLRSRRRAERSGDGGVPKIG